MNRCTTPRQIGDTRYVYGECTWHGPIAAAAERGAKVDVTSYGDDAPQFETLTVPCCPHCHGPLCEVMNEDEWWSRVRYQERDLPGYEAMLRWGQGRCFADFDTLLNAYRQAMEGQS